MQKRLVSISLGATICKKDGTFDFKAIDVISRELSKLSKNYLVAAVVGTGGAARMQRERAKKYSKNIDLLNIEASRLVAQLLIANLRKSGAAVFPKVLKSQNDISEISSKFPGFEIGVFGGIKEGLTSDSSAATIAREYGSAPLLIVSTRGGIFEKDPSLREISASRKLESVDRSYLKEILRTKPLEHVLDMPTCRILLSGSKGRIAAVSGVEMISKFGRLVEGKLSAGEKRKCFTIIC